jgi:hypothetical protein
MVQRAHVGVGVFRKGVRDGCMGWYLVANGGEGCVCMCMLRHIFQRLSTHGVWPGVCCALELWVSEHS